jgi:hypothetical protein
MPTKNEAELIAAMIFKIANCKRVQIFVAE